jgi:hypothetical protein
MAAVPPTVFSAEVTDENAVPNVPLKSNRRSGKVRMAYFRFFPTAAVAANVVIGLCKLFAGSRILGIKVLSNAFVATSTMDIGLSALDGTGIIDLAATSDSATFFTGAGTLAVATAGAYDAANTQVNNCLYELVKHCYLIAKLNTAGMDGVADILQGYVLYVSND